MDVNWFPGHMTRALRDMKDRLKLVDLVIEVCDARIPQSSRNPEIAKMIQQKKKILVMTKSDLADPARTSEWIQYYASRGQKAITLNAQLRKGIPGLIQAAREEVADKLQRAEEKGRIGRPVRAMVVGIPNTGKSTLINAVSGRKATITSDRPGVTRAPQWIRNGEIELMDMPGVLWPKIVSQHSQLVLAATGAIRDQVLDTEELSYQTMDLLLKRYPQAFAERFKLADLSLSSLELYEEAARKRGCILKGGRIDYTRFSTLFLDELRAGKMGPMTLEVPEDFKVSKK